MISSSKKSISKTPAPIFNARKTCRTPENRAAEITERSGTAFAAVRFETIKKNLDHLIKLVRLSKT